MAASARAVRRGTQRRVLACDTIPPLIPGHGAGRTSVGGEERRCGAFLSARAPRPLAIVMHAGHQPRRTHQALRGKEVARAHSMPPCAEQTAPRPVDPRCLPCARNERRAAREQCMRTPQGPQLFSCRQTRPQGRRQRHQGSIGVAAARPPAGRRSYCAPRE